MLKLFKVISAICFLVLFCTTAVIFLPFKLDSINSFDRKRASHFERKDRPDLAIERDFEMTKDPALGYPPVQRKFAAFKEAKERWAKKNSARVNAAIDGVDWDERGPNNVGGRTRALMFDPNDATNKKVWAGSVSGGLWFNNDITNPAGSWKVVDDFMANLAIASITFDPSNSNVFYLGTGEGYGNIDNVRGAGIWKTEDAGQTWEQLNSSDNSDFRYTQKLVVLIDGTVLAATRSGIFRSTNQGDDWTEVINGGATDLDLATDGTIYAGTFSGTIFKSVDQGETWSEITPDGVSADRTELAVASSNPQVIYALFESSNSIGAFKKSIDGGTSWADVDVPAYTTQSCNLSTRDDFTRGQAWYDLQITVSPTDENIIIVGGIDLYKSTDGGDSWDLMSYWTGACDTYVHADQHAFVFRPNHSTEAIIGNDGGVFYSTDIGSASNPSIESRNNGYNVTQFYSLAIANEVESSFFVAGTQDNGTQKFNNLGINSTLEISGGDGGFCFIDQDDPSIVIASFTRANYVLSSDGGNSFSQTLINDNSRGSFINPADYDDNANVLYTAGNDDEFIRVRNISSFPSASEIIDVDLNKRNITAIKASPHSDNVIYIGTSSGLFRVSDAADTPEVMDITGTLPAFFLSSIQLGDTENNILVTYSNYGVNSVFQTNDGGVSWSNKEGNLPDIPVRWSLFNPINNNEVFLATELGVWSTDDISTDSPNWQPTNINLANVRCDMLQIRESDRLIVVATHGRGVYSTDVLASTNANFSTSEKIVYQGQTVPFVDNSSGAITSWFWDFGDGETSILQHPEHIYSAVGEYQVSLVVNGGEDEEIKFGFITVLPLENVPYRLTDGGDFESENDFGVEILNGTFFERGNSTIAGKDGVVSGSNAWVTGLDDVSYQNNSSSNLISPAFDFSMEGDYTISFQTKYSFENAWDGFIVEYSINFGVTWKKLGDAVSTGWYTILSEDQSVFGAASPIFSGSTNGNFEKKTFDVSFLEGNERVSFRFVFKSDAFEIDAGMALDDFLIEFTGSTIFADFTLDNTAGCLGEIFTITDASQIDVTSYLWEFGVDATPTSATDMGPHTISYSTSGDKVIMLTINGENSISKNVNIELADRSLNLVTNKGILCTNEDVVITVQNSELQVKYQLIDQETNSLIPEELIGTGGDLNFVFTANEPKKYIIGVRAETGSGCVETLNGFVQFEVVVGPLDKTVEADFDNICEGEIVNISVRNSEFGVSYQLSKNGSNIGLAKTGNGLNAFFIVENLVPGSHTFEVTASIGSCHLQMLDQPIVIVKDLPDANIVDVDGTLQSSEGDHYQWYLNDEKLLADTFQTYLPVEEGFYSVDVISNNCLSNSAEFEFVINGRYELILSGLKAYPNPTQKEVRLEFENVFEIDFSISVYDMAGKMVLRKGYGPFHEDFIDFDMSGLSKGSYLLEVRLESGHRIIRIQKN